MNDNDSDSGENEDSTITLERGQTLFLAYKTEKHPDKFVTMLGVFTTYEAAEQVCTEDGEQRFLAPSPSYPPSPNKSHFYYDVTEVSLVK